MKRKTFWLVGTLGLGGLFWYLLEKRETRGFHPNPTKRVAPGHTGPSSTSSSSSPDEPRITSGGVVSEPRRCIAITQTGHRCTREAQEGSDLCWQHV
jgi:hypothetical protein